MASADEACRLYAKRFRIETFFSDQKSRGFHLHQSHLSDSMRLSRLLMAACLAYIWIVYLGALCEQDGWVSPCSRGEVEPHDFCSGGETIYEMRLHSAMMLSGGGYARRCIMAVAVQQIHPIAHLPLVLGV